MTYANEGEVHSEPLRELLRTLDCLIMPVAMARQDAPPASPVDGDTYIVGTAPTGAWAGQANRIARYSEQTATDQWEFYLPKEGWQVVVQTGQGFGTQYSYSGSAWITLAGLPEYADQAAATTAGLTTGELFRTAAGQILVKL